MDSCQPGDMLLLPQGQKSQVLGVSYYLQLPVTEVA